MAELQRLTVDHAGAVLEFEQANREYFARSISDRGDEYFKTFASRHQAMLDEQSAGRGAYFVLVADDGSVVGRFNLVFGDDHSAVLGYRVAEHTAGRGVATSTVQDVCRLVAAEFGLRTIRAATSRQNLASTRVLAKAGFVQLGPADPKDIGGKSGTWYELDL
jgi:ribosomal-protein-alanine N-acetyltransferase